MGAAAPAPATGASPQWIRSASASGKAAHEKGTAHEFTSEEARRAGSMSHGNRQAAKDEGNRQQDKQDGNQQHQRKPR